MASQLVFVNGPLLGAVLAWHGDAKTPKAITFDFESTEGVSEIRYADGTDEGSHTWYSFDRLNSKLEGPFEITKPEVVDAHRSHLEKINAPSFAELLTKWQEYLEGKGPEPG